MPPKSVMEMCVRWIQSDEAKLGESAENDAFERWKHVKVWLRFALHAWQAKTAAPPRLLTQDVREVYEPVRVLGKGAFGVVVLSRKRSSSELVAIKSIDKAKVCQEEARRLLTERQILSRTRHPFVIHLESAFESDSHFHFVLEYCPGGDLYSLLESRHYLETPMVIFYTASLVSALLYMHQVCGICYRDLKPENILLDAKGFIRLTDFGLAKQEMTPTSNTFSFCGSVDYMAPEVILGCGYGLAADVWSLGCVVYEMLTGLPPFYTTGGRQVLFERICRGYVHYPEWMPPEACTFIAKCLDLDPSKRWTVEQLLDHPFLSSIDWYQLAIQQVPVPYVPTLDANDDTHHFGQQFTSQPLPTISFVDRSSDFSAFNWAREPIPSTSAV